MVIEILFDESCNLFGDGQNPVYLKATLPEAEFVYTKITDIPYFAENDPDMIYIGAMSEAVQRRVIETLLPYKSRLEELIDKGTPILATGNAGEVFCREIDYVTEGIKVKGLGIFDFTVKTDLFKRYNGKFIGEFEGMTVLGFKAQFSFVYGDNSRNYFAKAVRGDGINPQSKLEGMRKNNLICTHLIGPILPLNPLFCEYFVSLAGVTAVPAYKDAAMSAFQRHLEEFNDPKVVFP